MIPILYEDSDLLIVEKPAGVPTVPLSVGAPFMAPGRDESRPYKTGQTHGSAPTLAEILAEAYPEIKSIGGSDWGAVHRLDVETSGLVVFARNQKTYEKMREAFSKDRVEREYLALVEGIVSTEGKINWPIGPDPKSSKKVKVYKNIKEARRHKAQEAVTMYEPTRVGAPLGAPQFIKGAASSAPTTLLRIRIKGGRRHQIRAHLAAIGHPVIFLHASRLTFNHPSGGGKKVDVQSIPPPRSEGSSS